MKKLLLILILAFSINAFSQVTVVAQNKWLKSFGGIKDNAGMFQGTDGFLYLVGRNPNGVGGGDIGIIKCDLLGNVIWSKNFGGAGNDYVEPCMNVVCEMNGRFTIVGTTASAGAGGLDILCFTIDSNGNLIRQKVIGGASNEMAYTIQKNSTNDGFVIGGAEYTGSFGANDHLILRTDTLFNITYSGHYGTGTGENAGKALLLSNGNILINGSTNNGPNPWDGNLILCNSAGTVQWAKYITGTGYNATETYDNNILSVGSTSTSAAGGLALEKIDQTGTVLLSKSLAPNSYAQGVLKTSDGGYALLGSTIAHSFNGTNWNVIFIKLDVNLNIVWSKIYGLPSGDQQGLSFIQKSDGGFLIAAISNIAWGGTAANEVVFISTDNLGNTTCDFASRTLTTSNFTPTQASSGSGALVSLSANNSSLSLANLSLIQNYPCGDCGGTFAFGIQMNGQTIDTSFCQPNSVTLSAPGVNSYLWSTGDTTSTINVSTTNSYNLQGIDINGCRSADTINISLNPLPTLTSSSSGNISCTTPNITLTGTSLGNTMVWNGGALVNAANPASVSSIGTYTVTATSGAGCSKTSTVTVTGNTNPPTLTSLGSGNLTCTTTSAILTGTSLGNTMLWNGGALTNASNPATVSAAGSYTVTATDAANGCTNTSIVNVTSNTTPPTVTSSGSGNLTCSTTSATLTGTSDGNSMVWNGGVLTNIANPATVSAVGIYTVTSTSAVNGCTNTSTVTITSNTTPPTVTSSSTAILCNGGSSTVTVTAMDGTAPYIGTGIFTASAGSYAYTVTDANGCGTSTTGTITEPTLLSAAASAQTNVSCNGLNNGSATIAAAGGTPGYTYSWSPSGGTGATASALSAGSYTCSVTDANSCTAEQNFVITEPAALMAMSSSTAILCNGGSSTVTVNAMDGTAPYTGTGIFSASAGSYAYPVTDANGCSTSTTGTITEPAAITGIQSPSICVGENYQVGTSTYTTFGTYTDILTAFNGCDSTVTTNLTVNSLPSLSVSAADTNVCVSSASVSLIALPLGGTWTGAGIVGSTFSPSVAGAGTHIITYTYTDINACSNTAEITMVVNLCTGINAISNTASFTVYPNPTNSSLTINTSVNYSSIQIVNMLGQVVLTKEKSALLNVSSLPSGIYFIQLVDNKGRVIGNEKFVKE